MESLLPAAREKYKFVHDEMENGFSLNINIRTCPLTALRTLPKDRRKEIKLIEIERIAMIDKYLHTEQTARHLWPPLCKEKVENIIGNFQVSPFILVLQPKQEPQLVLDFSFPYPSCNFNYLLLNDRFADYDPFPPMFWCTTRHFAFMLRAARTAPTIERTT